MGQVLWRRSLACFPQPRPTKIGMDRYCRSVSALSYKAMVDRTVGWRVQLNEERHATLFTPAENLKKMMIPTDSILNGPFVRLTTMLSIHNTFQSLLVYTPNFPPLDTFPRIKQIWILALTTKDRAWNPLCNLNMEKCTRTSGSRESGRYKTTLTKRIYFRSVQAISLSLFLLVLSRSIFLCRAKLCRHLLMCFHRTSSFISITKGSNSGKSISGSGWSDRCFGG